MKNSLKLDNYYKDVEKLNKKLDRKLKKQLKRNKSLTFDALKFEYQPLYKIIEEEIKKISELVFLCAKSNCFLLKMHEYYQRDDLIRTSEKLSLELIASFVLAVEEEPVFVNVLHKNKFDYANDELIENVIKRANIKLKSSYTETLHYYINLFEETYNEVYLYAADIVKEYFSE